MQVSHTCTCVHNKSMKQLYIHVTFVGNHNRCILITLCVCMHSRIMCLVACFYCTYKNSCFGRSAPAECIPMLNSHRV